MFPCFRRGLLLTCGDPWRELKIMSVILCPMDLTSRLSAEPVLFPTLCTLPYIPTPILARPVLLLALTFSTRVCLPSLCWSVLFFTIPRRATSARF
jgi:hypothetical protein